MSNIDTDRIYYLIEADPALGIVTGWHQDGDRLASASTSFGHELSTDDCEIFPVFMGKAFDGLDWRGTRPTQQWLKERGLKIVGSKGYSWMVLRDDRFKNETTMARFNDLHLIRQPHRTVALSLFPGARAPLVGNAIHYPGFGIIGGIWIASIHSVDKGTPIAGMKRLSLSEFAALLDSAPAPQAQEAGE